MLQSERDCDLDDRAAMIVAVIALWSVFIVWGFVAFLIWWFAIS